MNHPDEDMLLQYVLETLDEAGAREVRVHIDACAACRHTCVTMESQVQQMGSATFPVDIPSLPLPRSMRRTHAMFILRAAATLIVGFMLGYATALMSRPEKEIVTGQQYTPTVPRVSISRPTPCEQVDLGVHRAL